jgi:hypothetical protein
VARSVNARVRAASLDLTTEDGLPGDPWSRQLLFASDPDNGYSTLPLPAPRLALRAGDLTVMAQRLRELSARLDVSRTHLAVATRLLRGLD